MPFELTAVLVLAIVAAFWLGFRQQRLQRRKLDHRERLAAIDRGLPAEPEGDTMTASHTTSAHDLNRQWIQWFRLVSLALGLLFFFGGAGMLVAFTVIEDPGLAKLWSLGLIPIMAGVGLLLFCILSWLFTRD